MSICRLITPICGYLSPQPTKMTGVVETACYIYRLIFAGSGICLDRGSSSLYINNPYLQARRDHIYNNIWQYLAKPAPGQLY